MEKRFGPGMTRPPEGQAAGRALRPATHRLPT